MYGLKIAIEPGEEPISISDAKLHLRIDTDASPSSDMEDSLILALITAARAWCEAWKEEAFITQTWDIYLDSFISPSMRGSSGQDYVTQCNIANYSGWNARIAYDENRYIEIPKGPLQYIESLVYIDMTGMEQTVSFVDPSGTILYETDDYLVDISRRCGRLCLKNGKSWPSTLAQQNAIIIRFVAGYGLAANVPENVKAAIKLVLGRLYENRGDAEGGELPMAAKALLGPRTILA